MSTFSHSTFSHSTSSHRTENESFFGLEEEKGLNNLDYTCQNNKLSEIDPQPKSSSTKKESSMDITNHSIKSIDIVVSAT